MESKRQLTREELLEMESAPKTKMQHMLDVVICFCPYFAAIIMFLVYYLMPDAVQNFNPHVFTIVVCFFLALYLIMVVRGLLNKSYFAKVRHKAPLYSVITHGKNGCFKIAVLTVRKSYSIITSMITE